MPYTLLVGYGDYFATFHLADESIAKSLFSEKIRENLTMWAALYGPDGFVNSYQTQ